MTLPVVVLAVVTFGCLAALLIGAVVLRNKE